MLYEELKATDYSPALALAEAAIKAGEGSVTDALYGVMALEMLANELGIEGGYQAAIDELEKKGTLQKYVLDYLEASLKASGMPADGRIAGIEASEARAYVAHATAGGLTERRESTTHPRVAKFAAVLLEINRGDRVADFGSGQGFFLAFAATHREGVEFFGFESNPTYAAVSVLRLHALGVGNDVEIRLMDVFDIPGTGERFDKVFANLTIGIRYPKIPNASPWLREVASGKRGYGKPVLFDWVYNQLVVDSLAENGIGVTVTSDGALCNVSDASVRSHFVKSQLIESILRLPDEYVSDSVATASLLVLGRMTHEGELKLVDTRKPINMRLMGENGQEIIMPHSEDYPLNDISINDFAGGVVRDGSVLESWNLMPEHRASVTVGIGDITLDVSAETLGDCRLALRYYNDLDECETEELGSLITHVGRGVTLTASELKALTVSHNTGIRYLAPTGIEDGSISDDLPFLAELTPKMEKHVLKNGDLLISRIGNPYRIAVAEVDEDDVIVPNSNIFVLRVDEEKMDPYYLAAFLNSYAGHQELHYASTGSRTPSLSSQTLKAIDVITESYGEFYLDQETIAENYRDAVKKIRESKSSIKEARQELLNAFDEALEY